MDFKFSKEVKESETHLYNADGLSYGIPLRVHKNISRDIDGCLKAQKDWSENVGPIVDYHGSLGDSYSFISATVPECLPQRLEVIAHANEFAFLYDDKLEDIDLQGELEDQSNGVDFLAAFGDGCTSEKTSGGLDVHIRPETRLQSKIFAKMMALDPVRAITSMKAWAKFVQLTAKARTKQYRSLEEYIPARVIDAGELIWFGFLTFGMALTIPDAEYETGMEMARPAYAALGLTNDLYSWDKERKASELAGSDYVFNAIWVIMEEYQTDEENAKEICKEQIRLHISEFVEVVEKAKMDSTLSRDLRLYLEALLYSYSGNLAWSISCPRYNVK